MISASPSWAPGYRPHYRQAEAGPGAAPSRFGLAEPLECLRLEVRRKPFTVVTDQESEPMVVARSTHGDRLPAVPESVLDQVVQCLLHPLAVDFVAADVPGVDGQ